MRGANINYANKKDGKTALHIVIERNSPVELVRWLLRAGADPHIEDAEAFDCCDKAQQLDIYHYVNKLWKNDCVTKPHLRKKFVKDSSILTAKKIFPTK